MTTGRVTTTPNDVHPADLPRGRRRRRRRETVARVSAGDTGTGGTARATARAAGAPGVAGAPSTAGAPRTAGAEVATEIESLEDAYRRQRPALVRLAYVLTGSAELAEDVVHDAFVATSRRWADLTNTDSYLRRAVVNHARSSHRRAGRERDKLLRFGGLAATPQVPPEIDETWALLGELSPRQRAALVLRFYEDLPEAEIADLLGCRPGTVKSLIHRGLAEVREALP
jgi:DNA-directed RNA polymerase specialized sigma24 family protein